MKKTLLLLAVGAMASLFAADKTRIACIGDSITFGYRLPDRERNSYPAQLQKLLDEKFPGRYEVRNFGNSGRGIYLDSMRGKEKRGYRFMREHAAALEFKPDIVICNLGINDNGEYIKEYTGGRKRGSFVRDYLTLLADYARLSPKPRFFIWTKLSPLTPGQNFHASAEPFLMQKDLEEVARRAHAVSIDMQGPLREANMEKIFAADKIHPDAEGAKIIAQTTFDALMKERRPKLELPKDFSGEVWLCAGQSNMQKGWNEFSRPGEERERAKKELARLSKLDVRFWDFNDGSWKRLTPENAAAKSAFGVSFAIRRAAETKKPVAMMYVAAGGAPTEAFLSEATMCAVNPDRSFKYPRLAAIAIDRHSIEANPAFPCKWCAREYPRRRGNMSEGHWWQTSLMYDEGIRQIKDAGIRLDGILWYQGESNATANIAPDAPLPTDYLEETLRAIVEELRGDKKIPFVMMGLPRMNRPWEPYRAAQKKIAEETGAFFVDTFAAGLGDLNDVHPRNKIPFAELAVKALR